MVNCIGRINYPALRLLEQALADRLAAAGHVRMTSAAGCDVEFDQVPGQPMFRGHGRADVPGTHFIAGQLTWTPELASINGVVMLDGSIAPAVGLIREPVRLEVEKGRVVSADSRRLSSGKVWKAARTT